MNRTFASFARSKLLAALGVACAALLLHAFGAAAQGGEPLTVTSVERVPILVAAGGAGAAPAASSGLITASLIVTKEVVLVAGEVISQSVSAAVSVPADAPVILSQTAAPSLIVTVGEGQPVAAQDEAGDAAADATAPEVPVADAASGATANRNANLRGGPGTNYPVVGSVQNGAQLEIVAQNAVGDWYKLADGQWIAAFLVDNAPTGLAIAEAPPAPTPAPPPPAAAAGSSSPEQVIQDATAALARNPNDVDAYMDRALAYFRLEQDQLAIEDLTRAIALQPQNGEIYYARGVVYQAMGNCGQAVADFTQTINRLPEYANAYEGRALCNLDLGNLAAALPDLERLLALEPNHPYRSNIESLIQQIRQAQ